MRSGITVRVVPFNELANAVTPSTKLVACSHVSWVGGKVVDAAALRATGVSFLLDGAQGIGAVPVDVAELGCDFYAGSGQKWLCGPEGSGALYVNPERLDELLTPWPGYSSVAPKTDPLSLIPAEGVKRLDHGFPAGLRSAWAVASMEVLDEAGWDWVHERAASLAEGLADRLRERGIEVAERGRSTLVSWDTADADAEVTRLAELGIVVRSIPSHGLMRASVGAWSSEEELDRLAENAAS
jgi:L-cysteine/cystine lyase